MNYISEICLIIPSSRCTIFVYHTVSTVRIADGASAICPVVIFKWHTIAPCPCALIGSIGSPDPCIEPIVSKLQHYEQVDLPCVETGKVAPGLLAPLPGIGPSSQRLVINSVESILGRKLISLSILEI